MTLDERLDAIAAALDRLENMAKARTVDAVSLEECAARLSVHPRTVARLVRRGVLPTKRIGRRRVVPVVAINRYLGAGR